MTAAPDLAAIKQTLVRRIDQIDTTAILKLLPMVGRIGENAVQTELLDALRPRLRVMRPPRTLTAQRLFYLPFEHLLVNHDQIRLGAVPQVPRALLRRVWPVIADHVLKTHRRLDLGNALSERDLTVVELEPRLAEYWERGERLVRAAAAHVCHDDRASQRQTATVVGCLRLGGQTLKVRNHFMMRTFDRDRDRLADRFFELFSQLNARNPDDAEQFACLVSPLLGGPVAMLRLLSARANVATLDEDAMGTRRVAGSVLAELNEAVDALAGRADLLELVDVDSLADCLEIEMLAVPMARRSGDQALIRTAGTFIARFVGFLESDLLPMLEARIRGEVDRLTAGAGELAAGDIAGIEGLFAYFQVLAPEAERLGLGDQVSICLRRLAEAVAAVIAHRLDHAAGATATVTGRIEAAGGLFRLYELAAGSSAAFRLVTAPR